MKAVVWDGNNFPEGLAYRDFPRPNPGAGWALVENKAAGICGSDLHYLRGNLRHLVPDSNLPAVLGHENAGVVVEIGEAVTNVKPGDRVAIEPLHGCQEFGSSCPFCRIGQYHLCKSLSHVGIPEVRMIPGGYGEFSVAHESRLFPIVSALSFEDAALMDVLAVGIHAVNLSKPCPDDVVVVLGCGAIGLDVIQCLRACGVFHVIAIAKYEFQADVARRLGAMETVLLNPDVDPVQEVNKLTQGWGVDQVYECVGGRSDAVDQAIAMCRPGGVVVGLGVFTERRPIDLLTMQYKEIRLISSNAYSTAGARREFQIGLDYLQHGIVSHKPLITHRFSPQDYLEAIDTVIHKQDRRAIKAVFVR